MTAEEVRALDVGQTVRICSDSGEAVSVECTVAADVLPEVQRLPLAQAVVQLLAAIDDFREKHHARTLISIAADGKVLPEEQEEFDRVVRDL